VGGADATKAFMPAPLSNRRQPALPRIPPSWNAPPRPIATFRKVFEALREVAIESVHGIAIFSGFLQFRMRRCYQRTLLVPACKPFPPDVRKLVRLGHIGFQACKPTIEAY
jgi:hypothetical protein